MRNYNYKDIQLEMIERSITITGFHKAVFKADNGKTVNLVSNRSIKLAEIPKIIENNYKRIKHLIS
jgi:hypothetical protein